MRVPHPEPGNTRGWLLVHVPFYVGLVSGSVYAARTAPSPLSAALITVGSRIIGFGVGLALFNWRTAAATS